MPRRPAAAEAGRRIQGDRARLYETIRTAHLERAHLLEPTAIVYRRRRYDFDEAAASGLQLVQASALRAAMLLARSRVRTLEINEPLQLSSAPATALALAALAVSRLVGRPRTTLVAYAIENADPRATRPRRLRSRARRTMELALARRVWARLDRIVFGTEAARETYASVLPPHRRPLAAELVPALPAALPDAAGAAKEPDTLVYLGALVDRKGFPLVAAAWGAVRAARPAARLVILGSGAHEDLAERLASEDPSVTFLCDPARGIIRDTLLRSAVLTLPSQPRDDWREQVGLPIVEGLAAGCVVVTTTETGIAGWLSSHGHRTLGVPTLPAELADALVSALDDPRSAADVVSALPPVDGRLAADRLLFGPSSQFGPDQPPAVARTAPARDQRGE